MNGYTEMLPVASVYPIEPIIVNRLNKNEVTIKCGDCSVLIYAYENLVYGPRVSIIVYGQGNNCDRNYIHLQGSSNAKLRALLSKLSPNLAIAYILLVKSGLMRAISDKNYQY